MGHPDEEPADNGGIDHTDRIPQLAERDRRARRRRRVVARLKEESEVPLRSHGSLSINRALMAAGLVDRVQVTVFPVITGQTGEAPIFQGAADFDLELSRAGTRRPHPRADLPAHPACLKSTPVKQPTWPAGTTSAGSFALATVCSSWSGTPCIRPGLQAGSL